MWAVKHKSGAVLFVTNCERTASNHREMGWIVEEVKMTSREQFEAWATNAGFSITTKNDGYLYPATNGAWQAWQASREAIEIELPSIEDKKWYSSWHGKFREEAFWLEIKRRVVKLGLKVKQ